MPVPELTVPAPAPAVGMDALPPSISMPVTCAADVLTAADAFMVSIFMLL